MKIKTVAIGNKKDAFIENRFTDKVNVIFSDDNNKGKTIVIQGLMYAIGNEPIFPANFNYQDYYFFVEADINDEKIEFLRRKDNLIVRINNEIYNFNSLSELKYFINDKVIALPHIYKDNRIKMVDLTLLYEMFFVGQDKRDTSTLFNSYYKKDDFLNMLSDIDGYPIAEVSDDIDDQKDKIKNLKSEIAITKKKLSLIKSNSKLSEFVNNYEYEESYKILKDRLSKINENISYYRKSRKNEFNRKIKLELLLTELISLNREIQLGQVVCGDCGSKNMIYTNKDMCFDVSNSMVRTKIIDSIKYQINQKEDIIEEYSKNINTLQDKVKELLIETPEDIQNILLYSNEILSDIEYDKKLKTLSNNLRIIEDAKNNTEFSDAEAREHKKKMISKIVEKMNAYYKQVDTTGTLVFDNLFSKRNETFSGCEEPEFYYCRLLAINDYIAHQFPLIVDCYRDGEISTEKENIMIENYIKSNKQVILSSTLKKEEYSSKKYSGFEFVNAIDYSLNQDSKILAEKVVDEFMNILNSFNVKL